MKQLGRFLSLMFLISLLVLSFSFAQSYAHLPSVEKAVVKEITAKEVMLDQGQQAPSTAKIKPSKQRVVLLEKLAINEGNGQFTQRKYFSFMSVPITSTGHFIVKDESALWQTQQPVFSALLLTPNAIYRRLSLESDYQVLTDSAEFSAILATIFTGKVNVDDWQLDSREQGTCLELTPKSGQLKQLFRQVDLCLVDESNRSQQPRQITLTDSKGDKTIITMVLSEDAFISADFEALKLSPNQAGPVNDR